MKIVIGAGSVIWNESHPSLKKYGDDCIVVHHGPAEELLEKIGDDRNVLVLTDNDPASYVYYDMLAAAFHSRRIHLFACLPFTYESSRRKREIRSRLEDLEMVRSLCLVELDDFLKGSDAGETLGSLQLRIRNDMMLLLDRAVKAVEETDEFGRYLYDFETCRYVPADLNGIFETPEPVTESVPEEAVQEQSPAKETEETAEEAETVLTEEEPTEPAEEIPVVETPEEEPAKKPRRSLFSFLRRKRD